MTEKRFTIHKENMYKEEWYAYPFCIKEDGEVVLETIPLYIAEKVRDKLNEQQATIKRLEEENEDLRFALRTEQAFTRVEKDKKPFLSKEEFLKELEDECETIYP